MADIIQAKQDLIWGVTVSEGALHIEREIIFQLCSTANYKTKQWTLLQGTGWVLNTSKLIVHNLHAMNSNQSLFITSLDLLSLQLLKQYKLTNGKGNFMFRNTLCAWSGQRTINVYAIRLCLQKIVPKEENQCLYLRRFLMVATHQLCYKKLLFDIPASVTSDKK